MNFLFQKTLFHFVTTFTTPSSRDKNVSFSFSRYVHFPMIKRGKTFFFHLGTTFTTPWSQERNKIFSFCSQYVNYAMINRENNFFLFSHYVQFFSLSYHVHYAIIKGEKMVFLFSRNVQFFFFFFSFSYYAHYAMIKREKIF